MNNDNKKWDFLIALYEVIDLKDQEVQITDRDVVVKYTNNHPEFRSVNRQFQEANTLLGELKDGKYISWESTGDGRGGHKAQILEEGKEKLIELEIIDDEEKQND